MTTCAATDEGGIVPPSLVCRPPPMGFPDPTLLINLLKMLGIDCGLVSVPLVVLLADATPVVEDEDIVSCYKMEGRSCAFQD